MDIEFDLTEADILALMQFRLKQGRGFQNPMFVRRILLLASFVLIVLGTWLIFGDIILSLLFFVAAIIVFFFYPKYIDWLIRKKVTSTYRDPQNRRTLASRTLRATDEGLEETSETGEIKVKWEFVNELAETQTHAFITINKIPYLVVPLDRITRGDYQGFAAACKERIRRGTA